MGEGGWQGRWQDWFKQMYFSILLFTKSTNVWKWAKKISLLKAIKWIGREKSKFASYPFSMGWSFYLFWRYLLSPTDHLGGILARARRAVFLYLAMSDNVLIFMSCYWSLNSTNSLGRWCRHVILYRFIRLWSNILLCISKRYSQPDFCMFVHQEQCIWYWLQSSASLV